MRYLSGDVTWKGVQRNSAAHACRDERLGVGARILQGGCVMVQRSSVGMMGVEGEGF